MNRDELIGKVSAEYLRVRLTEDDAAGVARYLLDCLTADQTAAIAKAILADASLAQLVEIKLPIHFVGTHGLPEHVLTAERTTYFRNAACGKSALLVANTGDDEEQSLKELVPIGAAQLQAQPSLWVGLAADGLPITDQHRSWWIKAIDGLLEVRSFALDRFAEYILQTRTAIEDGQPILFALGMALPALHGSARYGILPHSQQQDSGPSLEVEGPIRSGNQKTRMLPRQADPQSNAALGRRSRGGIRQGEGLDPREHPSNHLLLHSRGEWMESGSSRPRWM